MKVYAKTSYQCALCGTILQPYIPAPGESDEPHLYHPMLQVYGECPNAYKKVRPPVFDLEP